ncbi:MAG: zincin-like metallopeptidase domain-containing protein, partial [Bacteroidales bacterium]
MKEKSQQESNAAERHIELLTYALESATNSSGYWLNTQGKTMPKFYPKGCTVNPFNALIMALNSDRNNYKTNLYTLFNEARRRGESIREHEKGVPFNWYVWDKYVNRNNPENIISKLDYAELSTKDQQQFKGVHKREVRAIFNIDQTLLPMSNEEKYEKEVARYGGDTVRGSSYSESKALRGAINDNILKIRENLMPIRRDGSGIAHYDSQKDVVYMPKQETYEHYNDYLQEMFRQIVGATGNQQRLAREGMIMKNGTAPSEDALKQERLIVEITSGLKMLEFGLPAKLSNESLAMVDYWNRELKENPYLIDIIESEVNNSLDVIAKAEQGKRIVYSSIRNNQQTQELHDQLPKHYYVVNEIKTYPSQENKMVVIVKDKNAKTADVILPSGASLEVNNEIARISKNRIKHSLSKSGFETINFYNVDGHLGYHPDDSSFEKKEVIVSRLRNWELEDISKIDVSQAVGYSKQVGFDKIQMLQDDTRRWAMYIKPEGKTSFSVYLDRDDQNRFFSTLKQAQDGLDKLRVELAQKYYAMSEVNPNLKVDLFRNHVEGVDVNRIQKASVFRTKNDVILCSATIEGVDGLKPRIVSPSQWQRMWVAEDRNEYKRHLAATLF